MMEKLKIKMKMWIPLKALWRFLASSRAVGITGGIVRVDILCIKEGRKKKLNESKHNEVARGRDAASGY